MISVLNNLLTANKILPQILHKILVTRTLTNSSRETQKMTSNQDFCTDIVWMDLEMTGLDIIKDKILEVSCLITDKHLNVLAEGPCFAINHPENVFREMNDWCIKHHNESGLVEKCLKSSITNEKGEQLIIDFLKQHIPKGKCPLAGNSVYMDRLFLRQEMPLVDDYMHYRIIDVSTIKELARRWHPKLLDAAPKKKFAHRSLDDIYESIKELKFYREHFFKEN
ncbi:putative oligoribonuclease [Lucilia cuprina]|uniref:Probable oligoribonuclease n=1 Tax=Lucilia cuprina TaxID=7375 RepID=A0A0L0BUS3_LUCCU|nr:probable oligoribonuclease [Lucilia cuprina]KAI8117375.1 putative oligoribonuclease [Lucilia cuprina]KNC23787.1 putative oligoribonuclease [Lucilia cuprina]